MAKLIRGQNDLASWCKSNNRDDLLTEWNQAKNGDLFPSDVAYSSDRKVWWACRKGHEWQSIVGDRSRGVGCPYCSNKKVLKGYNDLYSTNPELAKEWNYEKNGELTPYDVCSGSGKKVWWKDKYGHEWEAKVVTRTYGHGCPYCSNQKVLPGFNDLKTTNPDLIKEWHYEKNASISPTIVSAGSRNSVWWKCKYGHEWKAIISNRAKHNAGCPKCSGLTVIAGENDLQTRFPSVADEWDYEKNGSLTPRDVKYGSSKKVWWMCEYGHEWEATVSSRTSGQGCPYCSGKSTSMPEQGISYYLEKVCSVEQRTKIDNVEIDVYLPEYSIGIEYDGAYFHFGKEEKDAQKTIYILNKGIYLIRVKESDANRVINDEIIEFDGNNMNSNYVWALEQLFILLSKITGNTVFNTIKVDLNSDMLKIRERFNLYKDKNSLSFKRPDIAVEWNYEKNGILKPYMFFVASKTKVWWKCKEGHDYEAAICDRTSRNSGCPYCSNQKVLKGFNDLQTRYPRVAEEWNYEKNGKLKPTDIIPGTHRKIWWKCPQGHDYQQSVVDKIGRKLGCPICSGYIHPRIMCIETGKEYALGIDATKETGIDTSSINQCCKGKRKTAGGYHWKYVY